MLVVAAILVGYGLGCAVTGYYLVRWRTGQDIRALGSGKVGATNVGRRLGRGWALATVAGDVGKGALAVTIAHELDLGLSWTAAVACAVVAGHIWPAQLGFRGGRGAATAFGAALALAPVAAAGALLVAAVIAKITGRATPAGLVGIAAAPLLALAVDGRAAGLAVGGLAAIVLAAHRDHLVSLGRTGARPPDHHAPHEGIAVPVVPDRGS